MSSTFSKVDLSKVDWSEYEDEEDKKASGAGGADILASDFCHAVPAMCGGQPLAGYGREAGHVYQAL